MAAEEKGEKEEVARLNSSRKFAEDDSSKGRRDGSEQGFLGLIGGLFLGRKGESSDDREKREEEEYSKEMRRRDKAKSQNHRRERFLRPHGPASSSVSEKFCTESNEQVQKEKSYNIVVDSLDSLPPDVHKSIQRMKIPKEDIAQNLDVFLNVLSFTDKHVPRRRFMSLAQKEEKKKQKNATVPNFSDRIRKKQDEVFENLSFTEARRLYKWDQYLGSGGFGQVVEAKSKDKRDPAYNDKVAIKFQSNINDKERCMNVDEVSVLLFCDHPNIVRLYRALSVRTEVWFVMELLKGGTLKQASTNKGVPFTEDEIAFVAREMLTGIQYLHSKQIAHRDLKNLNIMLTVEGGIKLIDFGLAVDMSLGPRVQMVGSPLWMAPEMIQGVPHSYGVDIWSFTVCMLELANQRPPNASNIKRAMYLTATVGMGNDKFDDPAKWSADFENFVVQGAVLDPSGRPTADVLLSHKFISCACSMKRIRKKLGAVFVVDALSERGLV